MLYYFQKGFQVTGVTADGEFASLQECMVELPGAPKLNLMSANKHKPFIKHHIHVVKERVCSLCHSLPFKQLPKQVTIYMVFYAVKLLNYFPVKGGISDQYSPNAILAGEVVHFKYYSMPFGTYCQIHKKEGPQNSLAARMQGAISLGLSGNRQGGHKFLSLISSHVVTRRLWTILPMPNNVIEWVDSLGRDQPLQLSFQDHYGVDVFDEEVPVNVSHPSSTPVDYEIPGNIAKIPKISRVDAADDQQNDIIPKIPGVDAADEQQNGITQDVGVDDFEIMPSDPVPLPPELPLVSAVTPALAVEQGVRRSTAVRQSVHRYEPSMTDKRYGYTSVQQQKYEHVFTLMEEEAPEFDPQVVEFIFTQLTLKAVKNLWGDNAIKAAEKEMKQLHWQKSFQPVHWSELNEEQHRTVLESHIFLQKKRTGEVKVWIVASGNRQRGYIDLEEASSLTVATESFLLSCIIDREGCDVD